jgi:hypothetical protein
MKPELTKTPDELIARFGMQLARIFDDTLDQLSNSLGNSEVPIHRELRAYLDTLPVNERIIKVAQSALETFVHDLMSSLDESDDFKVVGVTIDGRQFDLRDLCPEGLHGKQLDWLENYGSYEDVYGMLIKRSGGP